jgi:hypothetical protein
VSTGSLKKGDLSNSSSALKDDFLLVAHVKLQEHLDELSRSNADLESQIKNQINAISTETLDGLVVFEPLSNMSTGKSKKLPAR